MSTIFKDKILKQGILSVDPGLNGAICLMTNKKLLVERMPDRESPELIKMILYKFREKAKEEFAGAKPIMIMEHVSGRGLDSGFTVAKLTFNYGLCWAYSEGLGMKPVIWHPATWKSYMKVSVSRKIDCPSVPKNKPIPKSVKDAKVEKMLLKEFPFLNVSKPEIDSVALALFGKRLTTGEIVLKKKHSMEGENIKNLMEIVD